MDLFLSFSDRDFEPFGLREIALKLEHQGAIKNVYYWTRDAPGGLTFDRYMTKYIGLCDLLVLICTQNSLNSHQVQREIGMAKFAEKPIIPVFSDPKDVDSDLMSNNGVQYQGNLKDGTVKLHVIKEIYFKCTKQSYPGIIFFESDSSLFTKLTWYLKFDETIWSVKNVSTFGSLNKILSAHIELFLHKTNCLNTLSLDDFFIRLQSEDLISLLNIENEPKMQIVVSEDLSMIKYSTHNDQQIPISYEVKNPKLLWEGSDPNDRFFNIKNPITLFSSSCPLDDNNRNYMVQTFKNRLIQQKFGKFIYYWLNKTNVWPPSIDSLLFIKTIAEKKAFFDKKIGFKRILDVGTGTGFLGMELSKLFPEIEEIYYTDLSPTCLVFTLLNLQVNRPNLKSHQKHIVHWAINLPPKEIFPSSAYLNKLDLIICNPPYIPTWGVETTADTMPVAGLMLMRNLLTQFPSLSSNLLIGCSNISKSFLDDFFREGQHEVQLKNPHSYLSITPLLENDIEVPFRVNEILKNDLIREKMVQDHLLDVREDTPWHYWHKINFYFIQHHTYPSN